MNKADDRMAGARSYPGQGDKMPRTSELTDVPLPADPALRTGMHYLMESADRLNEITGKMHTDVEALVRHSTTTHEALRGLASATQHLTTAAEHSLVPLAATVAEAQGNSWSEFAWRLTSRVYLVYIFGMLLVVIGLLSHNIDWSTAFDAAKWLSGIFTAGEVARDIAGQVVGTGRK